MHCEHCEQFLAELKETRTAMDHMLAEIASTRTLLESMQKTLFGNGQPGLCRLHSDRIARLERWRSWLAGALAVLGLLWSGTVTVLAAVLAERLRK